jgi:NADH-quinone oxidoreductase subunit J
MLLAALPTTNEILRCPTFWALLVGVIGIWLLLPLRLRLGRSVGSVLTAIAGALFAYDLPRLGGWMDQGVFWLLAAVTLAGGICTISTQSPVYSAIWFAMSLLGTAGLFFFQGAQFLSVATIVVYAGAIVVTFLFVLMLAQPEGHSAYDRISWGGLPKVLGVVTAGALVGVLTFLLGRLKDNSLASTTALQNSSASEAGGVLDQQHVAVLGRHLFGEHLVSVELAGTLLLVALVGAVAIAAYGKPRLGERIEEALR